jgi:hypothetical protein
LIAAASDKPFTRYMESKYYLYTEGALTDPDEVMRIALARYVISLDQKTWRASPKKNRVVAMVAKEKTVKKPKKDDDEEESPPPKVARGDKDAWKRDPPVNNEKTQVKKGKTYNWCKWHEMCVIHDPKSCTLQHDKKNKKKVTIRNPDEDAKPKRKPKGLKVSPALQSIQRDDIEVSESLDEE